MTDKMYTNPGIQVPRGNTTFEHNFLCYNLAACFINKNLRATVHVYAFLLTLRGEGEQQWSHARGHDRKVCRGKAATCSEGEEQIDLS